MEKEKLLMEIKIFMKVIGKMTKDMVLECYPGKMVKNMKEIGKIINVKVKELCTIKMIQNMSVNGKILWKMATE